jgi:protein-arginine kinase activator protein McsA
MVKILVSDVTRRMKCEMGVCKNKAVISFGPENKRHAYVNVCEDCARAIGRQLAERFFEPSPETPPETPPDSGSEVKDSSENTKAGSEDVYICNRCGLTFAKPGELDKYRLHIMECARKAKATNAAAAEGSE